MGIAGVIPLRTDVNETNLDVFIEEHAVAVVLVHTPGQPTPGDLEALAGICAEAAVPTALAAVDAHTAPGILAQFGIAQAPYLLLLRERVALYAERVLPSPEGLRQLLRQVLSLDMDRIREEIEIERRARESLETRRACPTLRSGPAHTRKST